MTLSGRERVIPPRIYICTATTPIAVYGTGPKGVSRVMAAGAHVDFDEVIGVGPVGPVTMEEALGAYAQQCFRPAHLTAPPLSQGEE